MTSSMANIRQALETHLNNMSGKPAIDWENVGFNSTDNNPFIQVVFQPVASPAVTIGANPVCRHKGLFNLLLCYPANAGPQAADAMTDLIMTRFKAGTALTANSQPVTIQACERISAPSTNGIWYQVPINITWYAFA